MAYSVEKGNKAPSSVKKKKKTQINPLCIPKVSLLFIVSGAALGIAGITTAAKVIITRGTL